MPWHAQGMLLPLLISSCDSVIYSLCKRLVWQDAYVPVACCLHWIPAQGQTQYCGQLFGITPLVNVWARKNEEADINGAELQPLCFSLATHARTLPHVDGTIREATSARTCMHFSGGQGGRGVDYVKRGCGWPLAAVTLRGRCMQPQQSKTPGRQVDAGSCVLGALNECWRCVRSILLPCVHLLLQLNTLGRLQPAWARR